MDRVGVLVTQWGEPEGFDPLYRSTVVNRTRGEAMAHPGEPFTDSYVGEFPFRNSMGLLPHAVAHPVPGMEAAYDSYGFFRLSDDGSEYVNVTDPSLRVRVADVPPAEGMVRPAREFEGAPARSVWAIDPRDGTDHLDGIVIIGAPGRGPGPNPLAFPTGIPNVVETSYVAGISDMRILFEDQTPRLSDATALINSRVAEVLRDLFGDAVDVRNGAYAESSLMAREDEVAAAMVQDGLRRIVIGRETTDNNNYANNFMSRDFVMRALARQGLAEGLEVQQVRQVGRTPEYNTALMRLMQPHLQRLGPDQPIHVVYCTYGLPWPGRTGGGPFSAEHPWAAEVYHENAYNNYLAFKRYAEHVYADYDLRFNRPGRTGDKRSDNLFSYGLALPDDLRDPDDPDRSFRTLRQTIDEAKAAKVENVLVVLSHWVDNNRDTLLAVRAMQQIPLNERGDFEADKYWVEWCEDPGSPQPVADGATRIVYGEAFDKEAEAFAVGYAHRLRGGVERFGVLPGGIAEQVQASGPISRVAGGTVTVDAGPLAGVAVTVPTKPDPTAPERFTPDDRVLFDDAEQNLVAAWDDYTAYVATVEAPPAPGLRLVGPAVLVGPYRTLMNRPATVTVPATDSDGAPYIFNEATGGFDPVYPVPGGRGPQTDSTAGTLTFDTQVFGIFVAAVPNDS